ncbi:putative acetyltransferase [Vibrio halioticoli NBRC 102217]|uniref:Putative acetyltransferase n=1 Tax=Vibrio halioticoli NBRC 102217 TaxID=1219072 RepID=V5FJF7_9VIBR|nr:GNAT family N-acetyltransferase [Vibrio halioticoli]GAD89891.1 putative acetyltransferase [Vibrio halioticoli NBRC 102217]
MNIQTPRLSLSLLSVEDWAIFHDLHTNQEVMALCYDVPSIEELQDKFKLRTQAWTKQSTHWLCLVITDKQSNEKVGVTGFCLQGDIAEVGYMLLPKFYGLGYATESLRAVIDWASKTQNIDMFTAVVTEGNIASERVLTKAGFTLIRTIGDASTIGNQRYADHMYYLALDAEEA